MNLVPFESIQKATQAAIALGLKQTRGDTPYANAFFKQYYGKVRPSKPELIGLFGNTYTIPQITQMVNDFLASNGTKPTLLPTSFTYKAFPSLENRGENRFEGHYTMIKERDQKLEGKHTVALTLLKAKAKEELLLKPSSSLGEWLDEYETSLDESSLQSMLREWYMNKGGCEFEYQYNLSHLTPRELMYQLVFI
ncbi:hypothetical protein [Vibrio owensii]|uniref:hypothetical protein n=1 Tax=Vibrio harveyi group TaxID=717610 RepID=UPI003CC5864D